MTKRSTFPKYYDEKFSPWMGCQHVDDGCKFCCAESVGDRLARRAKWGPEGTRVKTKDWEKVRRWNRRAEKNGTRLRVACGTECDIFEPWPEVGKIRYEFFELVAECEHLIFLITTKFPRNIKTFWTGAKQKDNVWLGTSVCLMKYQKYVDDLNHHRDLVPRLYVDCSPLLGPVLFCWKSLREPVDWVLIGGEFQGLGDGRPVRFTRLDDVRTVIEECQRFDIPCWVKQIGERPIREHRFKGLGERPFYPITDKRGSNPTEWPEWARIQEFPDVR